MADRSKHRPRISEIGAVLALTAIVATGLAFADWGQEIFATQDGRGWLHSIGFERLAFHGLPERIWPILDAALLLGFLWFMLGRSGTSFWSAAIVLLIVGFVYYAIRSLMWGVVFLWFPALTTGLLSGFVIIIALAVCKLFALAAVWGAACEGQRISALYGMKQVFRRPIPFVVLILIMAGLGTASWGVWPVLLIDPHWFPAGAVSFDTRIDLFRPLGGVWKSFLQNFWFVGTVCAQIVLLECCAASHSSGEGSAGAVPG